MDSVPLLSDDPFPAKHAFTTRQGGASSGPFASLNLASDRGDDSDAVAENRLRVMATFARPGRQPHTVTQVHGSSVAIATEMDRETPADALVSDRPGDVLAVQTADCLPLILAAGGGQAVAAVHAGWRGTVAGVVTAALIALRDRYGVPPTEVHAVIGPHARQAAYQVGAEVWHAFRQAGYPPSICEADKDGRYRLSVAAAVRYDLALAGVPSHHVHDVGGCTIREADRFYSHRRDGANTGRHWALVEVPQR